MAQNTTTATVQPFTVCPRCNYPHKRPSAVNSGRLGGKAKVPKGFSSPEVLAKALSTRREKAKAKAQEKPTPRPQ